MYCCLAKEVPLEDYKGVQLSVEGSDSLWIINTLNWYCEFSKSTVISVFTLSYFITTFFTISTETVPDTSDVLTLPFQPGPHCTTLNLRGVSNLRLYDTM